MTAEPLGSQQSPHAEPGSEAASPTQQADEAQLPHFVDSIEGLGDHHISEGEHLKWTEMINGGVLHYKQSHPDRFHRRVRRGIPIRYRWQVWKASLGITGGELAEEYQRLCEPQNEWSQQIEIDISRTFPDLKSFSEVPQQKLLRVLNAFAAHNPDVGYCQGMNFVVGLLLIVSNMNEEESFTLLSHLMKEPPFNLSGFYREKFPLLRRYLRACDRLVAEMVPDLREHFIKEQVQPAVYLHQWFLTLFINCFPLSMVMIIWDVILCEGLPVILRIVVSILQVLKDSLLTMQFEDIVKFFKMMKTYDEEDGELNAFRIGQLLMKHTEHVQIPERTMEFLTHEGIDDDINLDSDGSWEADPNSGSSWMTSLSRMFAFGPGKRRSSIPTGADSNCSAGATVTAGGSEPASASSTAAPLSGTNSQPAHPADSRLPKPTGTGGAARAQAGAAPAAAADEEDLSPAWEFELL